MQDFGSRISKFKILKDSNISDLDIVVDPSLKSTNPNLESETTNFHDRNATKNNQTVISDDSDHDFNITFQNNDFLKPNNT